MSNIVQNDASHNIEFGVHWLTVSFRGNLPEHIETLKDLLGVHTSKDRGGYGYKASIQFLCGAVLFLDPDCSHMTLVLSGETCEVVGLESILVIMALACGSGGKVTRIDLAFDHFDFTPRKFWQAFKRADGVKCKAWREPNKDDRGGCHFEETINHKGETAYIGTRASERYMRVYDQRGFTRVELEVKGTQAKILSYLILNTDEVLRIAQEFVHAFLDMKSSLWAYFARAVISSRPVRLLKVVTREKLMSWLSKQVAAPLAALVRTQEDTGLGVLWDLLECGSTKDSFYEYVAKLTE